MNPKRDFVSLVEIDLVDLPVADPLIPDLVVTPAERRATTFLAVGRGDRAVLAERRVRARLLAWSTLGVVLLVLGLRLQPHGARRSPVLPARSRGERRSVVSSASGLCQGSGSPPS